MGKKFTLEDYKKYGAVGASLGTLSKSFEGRGDTGLGLGAISSGIGLGSSAAFALGSTPIGLGVGAAATLLSFASSKKRRKRAREEANRRRFFQWQQALKSYKSQVKQQDKAVKKQVSQIEKALGTGLVRETILGEGQKEAAKAVAYMNRQAAGADIIGGATAQEKLNIAAEQTREVEETFEEKADKLERISSLLEQELTAGRSLGEIKTFRFDEATKLADELDLGDYS